MTLINDEPLLLFNDLKENGINETISVESKYIEYSQESLKSLKSVEIKDIEYSNESLDNDIFIKSKKLKLSFYIEDYTSGPPGVPFPVPTGIFNIENLEQRKSIINNFRVVIIAYYTNRSLSCKFTMNQISFIYKDYQEKYPFIKFLQEDLDNNFGDYIIEPTNIPCFHIYINGELQNKLSYPDVDLRNIKKNIEIAIKYSITYDNSPEYLTAYEKAYQKVLNDNTLVYLSYPDDPEYNDDLYKIYSNAYAYSYTSNSEIEEDEDIRETNALSYAHEIAKLRGNSDVFYDLYSKAELYVSKPISLQYSIKYSIIYATEIIDCNMYNRDSIKYYVTLILNGKTKEYARKYGEKYTEQKILKSNIYSKGYAIGYMKSIDSNLVDDIECSAYATKFAEAYEIEYNKLFDESNSDSKYFATEYAEAYATKIADSKLEKYAKGYAIAITDGYTERYSIGYATGYSITDSPSYAEGYAIAIQYGYDSSVIAVEYQRIYNIQYELLNSEPVLSKYNETYYTLLYLIGFVKTYLSDSNIYYNKLYLNDLNVYAKTYANAYAEKIYDGKSLEESDEYGKEYTEVYMFAYDQLYPLYNVEQTEIGSEGFAIGRIAKKGTFDFANNYMNLYYNDYYRHRKKGFSIEYSRGYAKLFVPVYLEAKIVGTSGYAITYADHIVWGYSIEYSKEFSAGWLFSYINDISNVVSISYDDGTKFASRYAYSRISDHKNPKYAIMYAYYRFSYDRQNSIIYSDEYYSKYIIEYEKEIINGHSPEYAHKYAILITDFNTNLPYDKNYYILINLNPIEYAIEYATLYEEKYNEYNDYYLNHGVSYGIFGHFRTEHYANLYLKLYTNKLIEGKSKDYSVMYVTAYMWWKSSEKYSDKVAIEYVYQIEKEKRNKLFAEIYAETIIDIIDTGKKREYAEAYAYYYIDIFNFNEELANLYATTYSIFYDISIKDNKTPKYSKIYATLMLIKGDVGNVFSYKNNKAFTNMNILNLYKNKKYFNIYKVIEKDMLKTGEILDVSFDLNRIATLQDKTPEWEEAYKQIRWFIDSEIFYSKSEIWIDLYCTEYANQLIYNGKTPVYSEAYANEIAYGKTEEYAIVYASAYDVEYNNFLIANNNKKPKWIKKYIKLMLEN